MKQLILLEGPVLLTKGLVDTAFYGMGLTVLGKSSRSNQVKVGGGKKVLCCSYSYKTHSPPWSFDPMTSMPFWVSEQVCKGGCLPAFPVLVWLCSSGMEEHATGCRIPGECSKQTRPDSAWRYLLCCHLNPSKRGQNNSLSILFHVWELMAQTIRKPRGRWSPAGITTTKVLVYWHSCIKKSITIHLL